MLEVTQPALPSDDLEHQEPNSDDLSPFLRWFGASKATDFNGEPLRLYHGTLDKFDVFRRGDLGIHVGDAWAANVALENQIANQPGQDYQRLTGGPHVIDNATRGDYESWSGTTFLGATEDAEEAFRNAEIFTQRLVDSGAGAELSHPLPDSLAPHLIPVYVRAFEPARLPDMTEWKSPAHWVQTLGATEAETNIPQPLRDQLLSIAGAASKADGQGNFEGEIWDALEQWGYDSIVYANHQEGDGADSWILRDSNQLKSATGNNGEYSPYDPDIRRSVGERFHSALLRALKTSLDSPKNAEPARWLEWLDGAQRRGAFKGAERKWLELDAWIAQKEAITRSEIASYVTEHQLLLQEDTLSGRRARFAQYSTGGGHDYKEFLLTLPLPGPSHQARAAGDRFFMAPGGRVEFELGGRIGSGQAPRPLIGQMAAAMAAS